MAGNGDGGLDATDDVTGRARSVRCGDEWVPLEDFVAFDKLPGGIVLVAHRPAAPDPPARPSWHDRIRRQAPDPPGRLHEHVLAVRRVAGAIAVLGEWTGEAPGSDGARGKLTGHLAQPMTYVAWCDRVRHLSPVQGPAEPSPAVLDPAAAARRR